MHACTAWLLPRYVVQPPLFVNEPRRHDASLILLFRCTFYRVWVVFKKLWKSGLWLGLLVLASGAWAQQRPVGHSWHRADLPTGWVARDQVANQPALRGYVQPIELSLPPGARITVWDGTAFGTPVDSRMLVGLEVGGVYAFQVSSIRFWEGFEVFPTVEVVNRLYPPEGKKLRFPVPIQITQEELEAALQGRFVTRVIYLESAESTLPGPREPGVQDYFEVAPGTDPLQTADQLGRPIAILRMGSRVPSTESLRRLAASCLPPELYPIPQPPAGDLSIEKAIERETRHYPRVPRNRTIPPGQRPPVWPTPLPMMPTNGLPAFGTQPESISPGLPLPADRQPSPGSPPTSAPVETRSTDLSAPSSATARSATAPPAVSSPAGAASPADGAGQTVVSQPTGRTRAAVEPPAAPTPETTQPIRRSAIGPSAAHPSNTPLRSARPKLPFVAVRSEATQLVHPALKTSDARSLSFHPVVVR